MSATLLNKKEKRQLAILSRYYKVDYEKRLITIPFHYKKASDLFDPTVGEKKLLRLNDEIMQKISNLADKIPFDIKIDVSIAIDDYESYTPQEITQSIKDAFELYHYAFRDNRRDSKVKFAILCVVGILLFGIWALLSVNNFISEESIIGKTIIEVLYCVPCVLFWEAIYVIFWPDKTFDSINYTLLKKINSFTLKNKFFKALKIMDTKEFFSGWQELRRKDRFFKLSFMWIGTIILVFVVLNLLLSIEVHGIQSIPKNFAILGVITASLDIVVGILASIVSFSLYVEKLKIRKYSHIFIIILVAVVAFDLGTSIWTYCSCDVHCYIIVFTSILFASSIYLLICDLYLKKLNYR